MIGLLGDTEEAASLATKAYADALRILGPEHFVTGICRHALQPSERPTLVELSNRGTTPEDDGPYEAGNDVPLGPQR